MKIHSNVSFGRAVLVKSAEMPVNDANKVWRSMDFAVNKKKAIGIKDTMAVCFPHNASMVLVVSRDEKRKLKPLLYRVNHLAYSENPKKALAALEKQMYKIAKSPKTKVINYIV